MRSCINPFARLLTLMLLMAIPHLSWSAPSPHPATLDSLPPLVTGPSWQSDLDVALAQAAQENKPVLVYFSSSKSTWCAQFESDVLNVPAQQASLEKFILVQIDPVKKAAIAGKFRVLSTPAIRFLSPAGTEIGTLNGAVNADQFQAGVRSALNPETASKGQDVDVLFTQLGENTLSTTVSSTIWPTLMLAMGDPQRREKVHQSILALRPFPKKELVKLLQDPRIAVRLGAMELLEEVAGDSYRFNPWKDDPEAPSQEALARWQAWADGTSTPAVASRPSQLSPAEIAECIKDLISTDHERSSRALSRLSQSGPDTIPLLNDFMEHNKELAEGSRRKVKEALYFLMLQGKASFDVANVSHQLLFGNLDNRLQAITDLSGAHAFAFPILTELVSDREPIVRETAIDSAFAAAPYSAVTLVATVLPSEKDTNVILSSCRGLSSVNTPQSISLLRTQLDDSREEVISAALSALAELKATQVEPDVRRLLGDERWRVRVSALETATAIPLASLTKEIAARVKDSDEFVRISAITALSKIDGNNFTSTFDEAFFKDDALKPVVIQAYESIQRPIPTSFFKALENKPPEVLLPVLSSMESMKGANALVPIYFSRHKDMDISCAAVRVMARYGMEQPNCVDALVKVLREGPDEKRLAVFDHLDTSSIKEQLRTVQAEGTSSTNNSAFAAAVVHCMQSTTSPKLAYEAGLSLLQCGNPIGAKSMGDISLLPTDERKEIAEGLDDMDEASASAISQKLLQDPSQDVRIAAVHSFLNQKKLPFGVAVSLIADPQTVSIDKHIIQSFNQATQSRKEFRAQAILALKLPTNSKIQTLILTGLNKAPKSDAPAIFEFTKSSDPWLRRAAWYSYGEILPEEMAAHADEISKDPSPYVREVVPALFSRPPYEWVNYIDKDTFDAPYFSRQSHSEMTDDLEALLNRMATDGDPRVRVSAYFALFSNNRKVNMDEMTHAVQNDSDQKWIRRLFSQYFESNAASITDDQLKMLSFAEDEPYFLQIRRMRARMQSEPVAKETATFSQPVAPVAKTVAATVSHPIATAGTQPVIKLVFFESPGCTECLKIKKLLGQMRESVPGLDVETHNIRTTQAMRLNEALSQKFGVPNNLRLIAPTLFAGNGFLVKADITPERLGHLIASSAEVPLESWYQVEEAGLAQAETSISQRYSTFNAGVILLAGLLDGVNPCAFATIIFFLSYLQVARRTPAQIAQVGVTFVIAVFLTYFLLGLGLVEIVGRLMIFKWLSTLLNFALAIFALFIAILSFRDGLLCARGQMTEMTLQLPEFLKTRIHAVVRANVRQSRLVIAAFATGVTISLLELACTGQVYAPTILFMLKTGRNQAEAFGYLFAYNVAFILPLLLIFLLAYFGLRSETLGQILKRHAAPVKFATATLFFVLFLLIAFGDRLATALG